MDKYYKIRFSVSKNPVKGYFSVRGKNKIDALITANKRVIDFKLDIQFDKIDEISLIEYYESFFKDRTVESGISSIN